MSWQERRAAKAYAKQQYDKDKVASAGSGGSGYGDCGPPNWDRACWDSFYAQYGYYPYGWQDGARVMPPTFAGCPDWAYDLMGLRKPPVTVEP